MAYCCRGACVVRWLLAAGLAAGIALLAIVQSGASPNASQEPDDIPLRDHMMAVNTELRNLLRTITDASKKKDSLKAVAEIQGHILAAKVMSPTGVERLAEAERAAHILDFRKALAELLGEFTKVEVQVIEGKGEDAAKHIRDTIVAMRNAAHEKFQVKD